MTSLLLSSPVLLLLVVLSAGIQVALSRSPRNSLYRHTYKPTCKDALVCATYLQLDNIHHAGSTVDTQAPRLRKFAGLGLPPGERAAIYRVLVKEFRV